MFFHFTVAYHRLHSIDCIALGELVQHHQQQITAKSAGRAVTVMVMVTAAVM